MVGAILSVQQAANLAFQRRFGNDGIRPAGCHEHGIGDLELAPLTLRRNFRSGEHLVDWFNTVFPDVMADHDDPASGAVSYSESLSVPQAGGPGQCVVHPLFGNDKEQEARTGLQIISNTLEKFPEDSMAVLVRGRNQLPELLAELRSPRAK